MMLRKGQAGIMALISRSVMFASSSPVEARRFGGCRGRSDDGLGHIDRMGANIVGAYPTSPAPKLCSPGKMQDRKN